MTGSTAQTVRGTLGSSGAGQITIQTNGFPVISVEISGVFVQSLEIDETINGTNWLPAQVFNEAGVAATNTPSAPGRFFINAAGRVAIRVTQTGYTSGTATIVMATGEGNASAASGGGGGGAVTIADGADVTQGTTTDAGIIADTSGTVIGFLRGAIKMWITFLSRLPAALVGGRLDVNLGAAPATVTVTGTVTSTPSGTQAISAASLPLPAGASTEATLGGVLTTADFDTKAGSLTEAAPANDTASSGLNGRMQRVAQRITSMIALLPAALVGGRLDVNVGAAPASLTVGSSALPTGAATDTTVGTLTTQSDFDTKIG